MIPAVIGAAAAVAVASGVMQYYNAAKARKATKERLAEIERMFAAIVPPDLGIKVWDDPKFLASVPEPAFNMEAITPKMYERVGQYIPQAAAVIAEKRPDLVQASEAAKKGRESQMEALENYRRIARSDFDPELAQRMAESSRKARSDAQSRQASILQDAARRGQASSLGTMAMQSAGTSDAMERQAIEGQMAAAESYRNRLAAMQRGAELGGQVRQSEMAEAGRNTDIINDFNQRTSARYQQAAQQRADLANQGQLYNLGQDQRISDANVDAVNKSRYERVGRANDLRQRAYGNARQTRADRIQAQKDKIGYIQQDYDNRMANASTRAGVSYNRVNQDQQNTRDTNAAIQGGADSLMAGAQYYDRYGGGNEPEPNDRRQDYNDVGGRNPGNYRRLDDDYWRTS
jgi:hypothetical protein